MSVTALRQAWRSLRRRAGSRVLVGGAPAVLLAPALAWRLAMPAAVWPSLVLGSLVLAGIAVAVARHRDATWLRRRLDRQPAMQDSAGLLFAEPATLAPLPALQRERLLAALPAVLPRLREPWPWMRLWTAWAVAGVLLAAVLLWPPRPREAATAPAGDHALSAAGAPVLRQARLFATPPAYTGQPAAALPSLDARLPQGSRLRWTLHFDRAPRSVALQFADGRRQPLALHDGAWVTEWTLARSSLYRLRVDERPLALHRLEAVPDRPPQVRVLAPDAALVIRPPGQGRWPLRFEARDDYGVAADAELRITLAQGSGENIRFSEQRLRLSGSGAADARRFARDLEPEALGMGPGDDLIVQLEVSDNRRPTPQTARSGSVVLRWPSPQQALGGELEASVRKTLPAYFRSQRQIILDAEALLKERRRLDADTFLKRSDAIGVDQRILRLRYGQFLGEESEGAPRLPTADDAGHAQEAPAPALPTADDLPTADTPPKAEPAAQTTPPAAEGAAALDDHDHDAGGAGGRPVFGEAGNVLAEFGHTHDHAEAATLLDPRTRALLKSALDRMWSAEGELRQGRPEAALPFAYAALGFIKQVQQAERIYLARLGLQLPPIDEGRRLGGDRAGLARREDALQAATPPDPSALALWQALAPGQAEVPPTRVQAFAQWLSREQPRVDADLSLSAALEQWRAEPGCLDCRERLRAQLWRAVAPPPAQLRPRPAAEAAGQRYLDALPERRP